MIRKFVQMKETLTDFCCVLNIMGMEVLNSVLSNTKCCKFYDE